MNGSTTRPRNAGNLAAARTGEGIGLYHTTGSADEILANGFRDNEGYFGTRSLHRGVWLADRPLDVNEGATGEVVLKVDMPLEVASPYEWAEDGKSYREFLIPAGMVNGFPVRVWGDIYDEWPAGPPT